MQYDNSKNIDNSKTYGFSRLRLAAMSFLLIVAQKSYAIDQVDVDVELQLLLDVSGSVNSNEYQLQLDGYTNAFSSDSLQTTILGGDLGKIAVQMIMWSGPNDQNVVIDWTLVDSTQSANSLSELIADISRPFAGWTAIGSAIEYSYPEFSDNGFNGTRNIIDVSGDGTNNSGTSIDIATDLALNNGVDTINGIVITTNQRVIDEYVDNVAGGENAFVIVADNYVDFEAALAKKLEGEISGNVPNEAIPIAVSSNQSSLAMFISCLVTLTLRQRVLNKE